MRSIHIRKADQDDIPVLQAIQRDAGELFRTVGMDDVADSPPKDAAELAGAIDADLIWVVCAGDGMPTGFAQVLDHEGVAHLEEISLGTAHGRRGLGTALLRAVIGDLAAQGYRRMTLSTFAHLPWNRPFYEKLGFAVIAEAEWTPALRQVRRNEAAMGLDIASRVIMAAAL
ncbi:GNAT family N-acetyltransferase [Emcibacter sp. SYSU 3D8]|uniref:GNAT family N-acetyltransferase n=1 Tax=Emcibacter sp. SYSU 3D8 TaxID=3133969 RepID=UPI0031FEEF2B